MANGDWTDKENDLIVADYFAMLADDIAGRPYNKAEHNRQLQRRIDRSRTSIEFKHQNISAVLKELGQDWIPGYKPAVQLPAVAGRCGDALVERAPGLARRVRAVAWASRSRVRSCGSGRHRRSRNQPPPQELEQMLPSPANMTSRAGTSAIAPSAAPGRSACWRTSGPC